MISYHHLKWHDIPKVNRKAIARSNAATSDTGSVMTLVAGGDSPGLLRGPRARLAAAPAHRPANVAALGHSHVIIKYSDIRLSSYLILSTASPKQLGASRQR